MADIPLAEPFRFLGSMGTAIITPTSLREHIAAEEAPVVAKTEPQAAPVVTEPAKIEPETVTQTTPEQEADSPKKDSELSEAAKTLRKNRSDERVKRLRVQNDELARELHRASELRRQRSELEQESRPVQPRTAAGTAAGTTASEDFDFPEYDEWATRTDNAGKTFKTYMVEFADHRDAWRESRRVRVERQTSQERTVSERASALDALQEKGRAAYADFDAVVDVVRDALLEHPGAHAIAEFFTSSQVGEDLVYRLGKHADALKAVRDARTGAQLARALHDVELQILTPTAASKPVTRTPAPPSHTVSSGGSSASMVDLTKPGASLRDHIRIEEAELAERRKAGYRY